MPADFEKSEPLDREDWEEWLEHPPEKPAHIIRVRFCYAGKETPLSLEVPWEELETL